MSTLVVAPPPYGLAYSGTAVSEEAQVGRMATSAVEAEAERSVALFGRKSAAIAQIWALVAESGAGKGDDADRVSDSAAEQAADFIRALPEDVPLPEFAWEPDGSISLDWIKGRHCVFSLSIGENPRLPYAWVDGTDRGYGVARFDGAAVPPSVLGGITRTMRRGSASIGPY